MYDAKNGHISLASMHSEEGLSLELGAIQTVPEGQVIICDEPTWHEEYQRKGRVGLTLKQARSLRDGLDDAIGKMEESTSD